MKKKITRLLILIFINFFVFNLNVFAGSLTKTSYELDGGTKYDVYVPQNINSKTKVMVYSAPFDNGLDDTLSESIINSNVNAIVIFPRIWGPSDSYSNAVFKMIDTVKTKYNITDAGYIANGYSQPGWTAISTMVDYLEEHPNIERQLVLLNDGFIKSGSNEVLKDDEIAVLEKNNSLIIDYCQNDDGDYKPWMNVGEKLLNSKLDIIFVSPAEHTSYSSYHNIMYYDAYASGIYSKILSYVYENGSLPSSGYVYRVYNHNTNQIEEYSASKLQQRNSTIGPNHDKNKINIPTTNVNPINICEEARVLQAFKIAGIVLLIVKILVPLLIIVLGTIDFTKSLLDSGDKANKEALNMLVKRLIIGIIIFMIPTILDIVLSFVDEAVSTSETFSACTHCLFNPNDCNK